MVKNVVNKFLNTNLEGKEKKFNNIKLIEIVISLIFIVLGIILLINETASDSFISIFLGIIILLEAILNIYSSFMPNSNRIFKINVVFGVLYIIVAVLLFTNLIKFINYISIYYGAYLILSGLKQLINSIRYKLIKEDSWLITLTMAILIISLGALLIFYPFESFGVTEIIAIFSILLGILNINTSNLLRNRVEKFLSKVDND
jgi:uncharacterized membrane protein HdeD (DUF308 family)